jgi:hypothetical protein
MLCTIAPDTDIAANMLLCSCASVWPALLPDHAGVTPTNAKQAKTTKTNKQTTIAMASEAADSHPGATAAAAVADDVHTFWETSIAETRTLVRHILHECLFIDKTQNNNNTRTFFQPTCAQPGQAQFKALAFPLARLRRIAKLDENMHSMSTEVPLLLAKAAEAFVHELTRRTWEVTRCTRRCTISVRICWCLVPSVLLSRCCLFYILFTVNNTPNS